MDMNGSDDKPLLLTKINSSFVLLTGPQCYTHILYYNINMWYTHILYYNINIYNIYIIILYLYYIYI